MSDRDLETREPDEEDQPDSQSTETDEGPSVLPLEGPTKAYW
jgi:hypothetical protein